jgi:pimeloyl-ACP methyl ester carboxylesterase
MSFDDAVARIPAVEPGQAQVRIEKTPAAAFVYVGGTVTGQFFGGQEPWDMSSNILAMGGQTSDSERGVRKAISAAGVAASDRIVIVGHSQGGLLAQRIAADPALNVRDVVLVGSPQSPEGVPGNVHVVALENRNDPITALGGAGANTRADVTAERTPAIGAGDALAAHHLEAYRGVARDFDASSNPAAMGAARQVFPGEDGGCQATDWRIDRVQKN